MVPRSIALLKDVSPRDRHLTLKKSVTDGYTTLLKMLEKKRFDYMIEYEAVVRAYNEKIFPAKPLATSSGERVASVRHVFIWRAPKIHGVGMLFVEADQA
ncbi:hypothetical protein [Bdellovibrio bacteriovorus]|uniref:hypothetical protein n=1 Tax=Bdellovibrio bacteriovorus TaxID=959 RepID=UPI0035A69CD2